MQVEVIRTYTAKQPDELSLQVADVVLVSQTVEDGRFSLSHLLTLARFLVLSPSTSLVFPTFTFSFQQCPFIMHVHIQSSSIPICLI